MTTVTFLNPGWFETILYKCPPIVTLSWWDLFKIKTKTCTRKDKQATSDWMVQEDNGRSAVLKLEEEQTLFIKYLKVCSASLVEWKTGVKCTLINLCIQYREALKTQPILSQKHNFPLEHDDNRDPSWPQLSRWTPTTWPLDVAVDHQQLRPKPSLTHGYISSLHLTTTPPTVNFRQRPHKKHNRIKLCCVH